jgi:hypothetical protein
MVGGVSGRVHGRRVGKRAEERWRGGGEENGEAESGSEVFTDETVLSRK